ncbi:hypothetical protein [Streptomyces sp. NPDC005890]|uniref:hypothetical protein n=1 Tax=Streptomyces sp. NPDC005890 TaxID=3154568 RepID=UPI0033EBBCC8
MVTDSRFRVVGVAVQTQAHPVVLAEQRLHGERGLVLRPCIADLAGIDDGEVKAVRLGPEADLLCRLPFATRLRSGPAVMYLDGELQRPGVGGRQDYGAGIVVGTAAPAIGHLVRAVVVLGEADEVSAFAEVDDEVCLVDQHGQLPIFGLAQAGVRMIT